MSQAVDSKLALFTSSQQMLMAAQQSNWEQLALLEKQFEAQVKDYFQKPGLDDDRQLLARQLIEQQDQIELLIKKAQKQIQALMVSEEHNIKAMHSYLATEQNK
ncbi:hypothetical protein P8S54_06830 [Thiomicrospira sp. R3]|uniref:hypothetical protein n=1 Tax=Thiomicrospira sp. R3 TaxID=3035472 RepID=UPI00259B2645|nr:hypothetical protein [Thiomicrospira sp. R3]WFE67942.1 hypothetical protein P8S54_06830 [Thiomicrospira sp. R3]